MTARNGSGEWHRSVEGGPGTIAAGDAVHEWWTLVAVCVGTFMLLLDVTIVNVALPKIQAGLGSSFTDLQWVVDAYALTLAALLLTSGSLADLLGRRRIFAIGLVIFSAASLLCGVAFGVWGAVTGAAVSIGPIVGGALTDGLRARASFVAGLNEILLVAAVLALAGAIAALLLIRSSDFVAQTEGQRDGRPAEAPEPARA